MTVSRILVALAALALTLPAMANQKMVFTIQPTPFDAPAAAGLGNGYFKKQGINLKIHWVHRGRQTIQLLSAGRADAGIAALTPVLAARARGLPLVIIGLHSHGFNGTFLAGRKDFGLKTLAAFEGKKIGAPVGSGNFTVLQMAIKNSGLKPSKFKFESARIPDMPAAMAANGFDAVLCWIPYADRIVNLGYGKVVLTPTQLEHMADTTYPVVVITTEKTIRTKPKMLQHFLNAWAQSERFVEYHHVQTVRMLRKAIGDRVKSLSNKQLSAILYRNSKHNRVALNHADLSAVGKMEAFLYSEGHIKSKPGVAQLVDNQFAEKAQANYK